VRGLSPEVTVSHGSRFVPVRGRRSSNQQDGDHGRDGEGGQGGELRPEASGHVRGEPDGEGKHGNRREKGKPMSAGDKAQNAAERGLGKAKEAVGDATDNEELAAEGKGDQAKADFKDAGEKVKDAAEDAKKAFDR
jgi:uncharacterized protein YjbJ (UPF0337 family)